MDPKLLFRLRCKSQSHFNSKLGTNSETVRVTPQPVSQPVSRPHPWQCPLGSQQAPGLHWQLGLKELCESREVLRFALCFSFQPQPVPAFIISKSNKAPDGRKLAGAQGAGPSALGASQQIVPWKQGSSPCGAGGLGGASLPQHTGPWGSPCVSRTAALLGGTVLGR